MNNNMLGDDSALQLIEIFKGKEGNKKLKKMTLGHNGISIRFL